MQNSLPLRRRGTRRLEASAPLASRCWLAWFVSLLLPAGLDSVGVGLQRHRRRHAAAAGARPPGRAGLVRPRTSTGSIPPSRSRCTGRAWSTRRSRCWCCLFGPCSARRRPSSLAMLAWPPLIFRRPCWRCAPSRVRLGGAGRDSGAGAGGGLPVHVAVLPRPDRPPQRAARPDLGACAALAPGVAPRACRRPGRPDAGCGPRDAALRRGRGALLMRLRCFVGPARRGEAGLLVGPGRRGRDATAATIPPAH